MVRHKYDWKPPREQESLLEKAKPEEVIKRASRDVKDPAERLLFDRAVKALLNGEGFLDVREKLYRKLPGQRSKNLLKKAVWTVLKANPALNHPQSLQEFHLFRVRERSNKPHDNNVELAKRARKIVKEHEDILVGVVKRLYVKKVPPGRVWKELLSLGLSEEAAEKLMAKARVLTGDFRPKSQRLPSAKGIKRVNTPLVLNVENHFQPVQRIEEATRPKDLLKQAKGTNKALEKQGKLTSEEREIFLGAVKGMLVKGRTPSEVNRELKVLGVKKDRRDYIMREASKSVQRITLSPSVELLAFDLLRGESPARVSKTLKLRAGQDLEQRTNLVRSAVKRAEELKRKHLHRP